MFAQRHQPGIAARRCQLVVVDVPCAAVRGPIPIIIVDVVAVRQVDGVVEVQAKRRLSRTGRVLVVMLLDVKVVERRAGGQIIRAQVNLGAFQFRFDAQLDARYRGDHVAVGNVDHQFPHVLEGTRTGKAAGAGGG